ncbi:MAG: hypothetical protein FGF52_03400 [Candidatus Brockarchaeota archaeon]|nr:hypothetical protein [Candidatus Brockarchaeota archaeon]
MVFKKGEVIAIIELKSSVEKSPEELCEIAEGEEGLKRYVGKYRMHMASR